MAKKRSTKKRPTAKRESINTGRNKMFGKRGVKGRFKEMDDVGRSLRGDRRKTAKKKTKSGYGDQGDRARSTGRKKTTRKGARKTSR